MRARIDAPFGTPAQLSTSSVTPSPSPSSPLPSAGHSDDEPVHISAVSPGPLDGRHTVVLGASASAGQVFAEPLHDSAMSQSPAAERQTAVLFTSVGQVVATPSHDSGASHALMAARHTVPAESNVHTPCAHATLHAWQSPAAPPPQAVSQQ